MIGSVKCVGSVPGTGRCVRQMRVSVERENIRAHTEEGKKTQEQHECVSEQLSDVLEERAHRK